jgi:hypothetical protein
MLSRVSLKLRFTKIRRGVTAIALAIACKTGITGLESLEKSHIGEANLGRLERG